MRTRRRAARRPRANGLQRAAAVAGVAGILGLVGASQALAVPDGGEVARGVIQPEGDADLAQGLGSVHATAGRLEDLLERILDEGGTRARPEGKDLDEVRSLASTLSMQLAAANQQFETLKSAGTLGVQKIEDQKLSKALVSCLENAFRDAGRLIERLQRGVSPDRRKKLPKARKLEKLADGVGDITREALRNVIGVKTSKKTQKAETSSSDAQPSRADGRAFGHTYRDDYEGRKHTKRARRRFDRKRSRKTIKKTARKKSAKRSVRKTTDEPRAGAKGEPKNAYVAFGATGKVPADDPAFYFEVFPLELSGDVFALVDTGVFSEAPSVNDAAGDGEFACVELSTVDSAPSEQFVSCCGRYVAGSGFQAFVATPDGTRGNLLLPDTLIAQFRVAVLGGSVQFDVRTAGTDDPWQRVATVTAPPAPLTFSLGAAAMGTGDEVGFDDVLVTPLLIPDPLFDTDG